MLGITTPDAIAFGSLCAALLAAYAGMVKGDQAKKTSPPEPGMALIGSAIVDRETLRDLTAAVEDLVAVIGAATAVGETRTRDDLARAVRELLERVGEGERRR